MKFQVNGKIVGGQSLLDLGNVEVPWGNMLADSQPTPVRSVRAPDGEVQDS